MDFEFFENLSKDDAKTYLENFLEVESKAMGELAADLKAAGIVLDFTAESVKAVLKWAIGRLDTYPIEPDMSLPEWIRNTDDYRNGLFEFSEDSKILILRCAYYLGESFVRCFGILEWSTGDPETAEKNMPVVTGFDRGIEMATMMIVENLSSRILSGAAGPEAIDTAIHVWTDCARKAEAKRSPGTAGP